MKNTGQPGNQRKIRTLIVDDCEVLLRKLQEMLDTFPEIEVVARAANGEEALRQSTLTQPELVIMDVQMPVMDGFAAAREFEIHFPNTAVILTSAFGPSEVFVFPHLKSARFARKSRLWDSLPKLLQEIFAEEKSKPIAGGPAERSHNSSQITSQNWPSDEQNPVSEKSHR